MDTGFVIELNSFIRHNDYKRFLPLVTPERMKAYPELLSQIVIGFRGDDPELIDALVAIFGAFKICGIDLYRLAGKPRMLTVFLRHWPNYASGHFVSNLIRYWPKTFFAVYETKPVSRDVIRPQFLPSFDAFIAARESIRLVSCILLHIGHKRRQKDAFLIISRVVWSKRGDGN